MTSILLIACKDCETRFIYTTEAQAADRLAGRTPPERCARCRPKHRKEYSSLGVSHNDVLQIRSDGSGGLATYFRNRPPVEELPTRRLAIEPMPIETIIGDKDRPHTILHGLLTDRRRVHIVVGPTGSGKSTWLPFRLLTCDELVARGPIVITQPRIPATEGPAKFVAKMYYGNEVDHPALKDAAGDIVLAGAGTAVGYRYGEIGSARTDSANRLIFMTDGTLLNWIQSGEVRRCSLVIVDEAHERSTNIDRILALLKHRLPLLPHLQVMICSATVDAEAFQKYFGGPERAALYEGRGFTYPILDVFSDDSVAYLANEAFDRIAASDAGWQEVDERTRQAELLGPRCWSVGVSDHRLRYYPAFEVLVWQGVLSEADRRKIGALSNEPRWYEAINALSESAATRITLSDGKEVGAGTSIRQAAAFAMPRADPRDIGGSAVKSYAVEAAAALAVRLAIRDEEEAIRRRERWERRADAANHGWDELSSDGWSRLREPLDRGHILVFLPSSRDIDACAERVRADLKARGLLNRNRVLRFYREAPDDEKRAVTADTTRGESRRIVIGSNLAETSLTLDGLAYVIDSGFICQEYYDSAKGGKFIPAIVHSQAGCRQRAGRVGRKEPGEAWRLYTRDELREQAAFTTPEIARSDAAPVILNLVRAGVPVNSATIGSALMNSPPDGELARAFAEIQRFGAVDRDGDLTQRGLELSTTRSETFRAAQLLLEADRFGVLWEMAVFLAIQGLPYVNVGSRKIFALFVPEATPVYDDAGDSEEGSAEEPVRSRDPFDDPYLAADAILKRRALGADCLDDLELYLRIWQGWFGTDESGREAWACAHGVSHAAMKKVMASLYDEKKGMLRAFYAVEQKGMREMSRDVDFVRLDLVRFLLAAATPERIFRNTPRGFECSTARPDLAPRRSRKPPAVRLHPDTLWRTHPRAEGVAGRSERVREACLAVEKASQNGIQLRHLIWVDPEWLEQVPSFEQSPLELARRFSGRADRMRTLLGDAPFVTGSERAGLQWPMPGIPIPDPLRRQQWTFRFADRRITQGEIAAVVENFESNQKYRFVQIEGGPLLPLVVPRGADLLPHEPVAVIIRDTAGGPVAHVQVEAREDVAESAAMPAIIGAAPAQVSSLASRDGSIRSEDPTLEEKVELDAARTRRIGIVKAAVRPPGPAPGSLVPIRVIEKLPPSGLRGFVAEITDERWRGREVSVTCDLPDEGLRSEAPLGREGRICVARVEGTSLLGRIETWNDGVLPLTLADIWRPGRLVFGALVGPHRLHDFLRMVRVEEDGFSATWSAWSGPSAPMEPAGRRLTLRITEWTTPSQGRPWPKLKVQQWLD